MQLLCGRRILGTVRRDTGNMSDSQVGSSPPDSIWAQTQASAFAAHTLPQSLFHTQKIQPPAVDISP